MAHPKKDDLEHGGEEGIGEDTDPGVEDKRLLVLEGEFAQALKVMARPGNTLSPAMRNLWDHGKAGAFTKNDRTKCTGAHVVDRGAHRPRRAPRREMTRTEMCNGFANRILFVAPAGRRCCRRAAPRRRRPGHARLPVRAGGRRGQDDREGRPVDPRPTTRGQLWHEVYPRLSEGRPGMLGAVTARAEAIVMRRSRRCTRSSTVGRGSAWSICARPWRSGSTARTARGTCSVTPSAIRSPTSCSRRCAVAAGRDDEAPRSGTCSAGTALAPRSTRRWRRSPGWGGGQERRADRRAAS